MSRRNDLPFGRGSTYYNGETIDSNDLGGLNLEGHVYEDDDLDYTTSPPYSHRTGERVKTMIVRNDANINLLPKRLAKMSMSGDYPYRVAGYATVTASNHAFPIDEFLAAAGVPDLDLFHVVIEGPAMVLTDLAGADNNVFSVGSIVVALTAATSQATTAGRVAPQDLTGATAVLGQQVIGKLGTAMSAKTTAQTNGDLFIRVGKW